MQLRFGCGYVFNLLMFSTVHELVFQLFCFIIILFSMHLQSRLLRKDNSAKRKTYASTRFVVLGHSCPDRPIDCREANKDAIVTFVMENCLIVLP